MLQDLAQFSTLASYYYILFKLRKSVKALKSIVMIPMSYLDPMTSYTAINITYGCYWCNKCVQLSCL